MLRNAATADAAYIRPPPKESRGTRGREPPVFEETAKRFVPSATREVRVRRRRLDLLTESASQVPAGRQLPFGVDPRRLTKRFRRLLRAIAANE
jgi:hypothetical protein